MNTALKNMRKERGLTQVEIAKRSGVTEVSYQRYEAEERFPNVRTAIRIARTLNSTVEKLWGDNPSNAKENPGGNQENQQQLNHSIKHYDM